MRIILTYNQLEEILNNEIKYQDWNNIFNDNKVSVELDIDLVEFEEKISQQNSILLRFSLTNGNPIKIFDGNTDIEKNPSNVYFKYFSDINITGALSICDDFINPFKLNYFKYFKNNEVLNGLLKNILKEKSLTSNSLIINDAYIFGDSENINKQGSKNLLNILDAIIPLSLNVPYHVLILTSNPKMKDQTIFKKILNDLILKIEKIRVDFKIYIEIVVSNKEKYHKRKLFTNFLSITTDKGFYLEDNNKVKSDNDILIETIFTRNNVFNGDSQHSEMKERLLNLNKKFVKHALSDAYLNSLSNHDKTYYVTNFDYEGEKVIKNRLFNYYCRES
nr:hypothetical protein [uncultured Flavobacterium sp.]